MSTAEGEWLALDCLNPLGEDVCDETPFFDGHDHLELPHAAPGQHNEEAFDLVGDAPRSGSRGVRRLAKTAGLRRTLPRHGCDVLHRLAVPRGTEGDGEIAEWRHCQSRRRLWQPCGTLPRCARLDDPPFHCGHVEATAGGWGRRHPTRLHAARDL